MAEFFRHCPNCGRRFHVKLRSKKMISSHAEAIRKQVPDRRWSGGVGRGVPPATAPTAMMVGKPIIVDIENFQYAYKCGHCGHEWTETRTEGHRE